MTSPQGPFSSCQEIAGLLQPFVDGELSESESHAVLDHLPSCNACTRKVQEQQRVQAQLRLLAEDPPPAPAALRARVLSALDAHDAQNASQTPALANARNSVSNLRDRLRALTRGGLIMAPAAAAAGLMWVALGPSSPGTQPSPPPVLATNSPAVDPGLELQAAALPAASPPTILGGQGLPKDIEFVSAQPDVVRYRHAHRNFELIDRRQVDTAPTPVSTTARIHKEGQQTYVLSRDALGRAHLDFQLNAHRHRLTLVPSKDLPSSGDVSANDPQFAQMLHFARALQHAASHR